MKNYSYPIDYSMFNTEEIIVIINFLNKIEIANESKIDAIDLKNAYIKYINVLNSKKLEKQIDKDFEKISGYSIFKTMKKYETK